MYLTITKFRKQFNNVSSLSVDANRFNRLEEKLLKKNKTLKLFSQEKKEESIS